MKTLAAFVLVLFSGFALSAGAQTVAFTENFEGGGLGSYTETTTQGLVTVTLWHGESSCNGTNPIPAAMGTKAASYNRGDVGIYNYDTGSANSGVIESPPISLATGSATTLIFDYLKQTEGVGTAAGTGSFDQCFVESKAAGGNYFTDLQITGNSVCAVTHVCLDLAAPGPVIKQRFRFDTVDSLGNLFQGWTVDNIILVERLSTTVFSENFESGGLGSYIETNSLGVATSTLWHGESSCDGILPIPATLGTSAVSYNQGDIGIYNYDTGATNSGALESPVTSVSSGSTPSLHFDYLKETEGVSGSFDQCFVESRAAGGAYSTDVQIIANNVCAPTSVSVDLSAPGLSVQHRFRFDTGDAVGNDFQGWTIDNVSLVESPPSGTVTVNPTGCGAITITAIGTPQLGESFGAFLGGLSFGGTPVIWVGTAASTPLCSGCTLGANFDIAFFSNVGSVSAVIPCNPSLIGGTFSIQGANAFVSGGCPTGTPFPVNFTVSNTLNVVIG